MWCELGCSPKPDQRWVHIIALGRNDLDLKNQKLRLSFEIVKWKCGNENEMYKIWWAISRNW